MPKQEYTISFNYTIKGNTSVEGSSEYDAGVKLRAILADSGINNLDYKEEDTNYSIDA